MRRLASLLVVVGAVLALGAGAAQACACGPPPPLIMTANPDAVAVGEPVTFTITKTNLLPSDLEWSVRDHLPESMEFVSATPSQGTCAPPEGPNVVQCDLGTVPSWGQATMAITATPTAPGEITNYAADNGENEASATVMVE